MQVISKFVLTVSISEGIALDFLFISIGTEDKYQGVYNKSHNSTN